MKEFNTTGVCIPSKHYMVDITERVKDIKRLVDSVKFFCDQPVKTVRIMIGVEMPHAISV